MKKSIIQSFEEIMIRNKKSNLPQGAYTFWRDEYYDFVDYHEKFKMFSRWFDPSWSLPPHVEEIHHLFLKYFPSHKIVITDVNQGVRAHINPSRSKRPWDWKKWQTWSYTIGVPFDLNEYNNDVYVIYGNFLRDDEITNIHDNPVLNYKIEEMKILPCLPYTRLSFPSSKILHGVCASSTRFVWMFNDMEFISNPLHEQIDSKVIPNIYDIESDMKFITSSILDNSQSNIKHQFMSDLDFFLHYKKQPLDIDWVPNL